MGQVEGLNGSKLHPAGGEGILLQGSENETVPRGGHDRQIPFSSAVPHESALEQALLVPRLRRGWPWPHVRAENASLEDLSPKYRRPCAGGNTRHCRTFQRMSRDAGDRGETFSRPSPSFHRRTKTLLCL